MKVLGLISSPADPASRARIIQYKESFEQAGYSLHTETFGGDRDHNPGPWAQGLKKITGVSEWRISNSFKTLRRMPLLLQQYQYDLVWQNRLLLPQHSFFENRINKPVVFDYDDAIWINEGEKNVRAKLAKAAMLFAGNEYLAEYGRPFNKNIKLVPSVVDTKKNFPLDKKRNGFVIGWIGTPGNFQYLDLVKPVIMDFIQQNPDASFMIVSSEKPAGFHFDDKQIIFKPWSEANENEWINDFSVGIMPLLDTEWTRGKCAYKMLQYMACSKPVIVSPVGVNKQLLETGSIGFGANNETEWKNALTVLAKEPSIALELGENGRRLVDQKFSVRYMAPLILDHFNTITR